MWGEAVRYKDHGMNARFQMWASKFIACCSLTTLSTKRTPKSEKNQFMSRMKGDFELGMIAVMNEWGFGVGSERWKIYYFNSLSCDLHDLKLWDVRMDRREIIGEDDWKKSREKSFSLRRHQRMERWKMLIKGSRSILIFPLTRLTQHSTESPLDFISIPMIWRRQYYERDHSILWADRKFNTRNLIEKKT